MSFWSHFLFKKPSKIPQKSFQNLIKITKKSIHGKYARPHENAAPAGKIKGPGLSKILKKSLKNN